jgi:tetratricopeptide (TPR) repeat protein
MISRVIMVTLGLVLAGGSAVHAAPPAPESPPPTLSPEEAPANYQLCLSTARSFPEQGFELAGRWEGLGGGEPAKHCAAVALIGLHQYAEAASRLEDLAAASKQSADIRAELLSQAGQAWFLGDDNDHAYAAQSAALKLAPPNSPLAATLLTDRAATLADAGKYDDAVTDLTAALAAQPKNVDALTFRANAYHDLDKNDLALADAERAVALDGNNAEARLMRGILYVQAGRNADARQDWLKVLQIAPTSDAARSARDNLAQLDVNAGAKDQPAKP